MKEIVLNDQYQPLSVTEGAGSDLERTMTYTYYGESDGAILDGLLKTETDAAGLVTAYEYTGASDAPMPAGLVKRKYHQVDPTIQTLYEYDALGNLTKRTDAMGRVTTYVYDANNRLIEETDPLAQKTIYTYEGLQLIRTEEGRTADQRGLVKEYEYDERGRLTNTFLLDPETSNRVLKTRLTYDSMGRVIAEANALNEETLYRYNGDGFRVEVESPYSEGPSIEKREYDAAGQVIAETDPLGVVTRYTYDGEGRLTRLIEAAGLPEERTTDYEYDHDDLVAVIYPNASEDGSAQTTRYSYDLYGRKTGMSGDREYAEVYTYNAVDLVTTVTNSKGGVSVIEYDDFHRRSSFTYPSVNGDLSQELFEYDRVGNMLAKRNTAGTWRQFTYDGLDRLVATSIPSPDKRAAGWENTSDSIYEIVTFNRFNLASERSITGRGTLVNRFDGLGRVVGQTTATGWDRSINYNAVGRVVSMTMPAVDGSGGLISEVVTYDTANTEIYRSFTDRTGRVHQYDFDLLYRPVRQVSPSGVVTETTYDALGRATKVVVTPTDSPVRVIEMTYDRFDQVTSRKRPDHVEGSAPGDPNYRIETTAYDNFGNVVAQSGVGGYPVSYQYDAIGNLESLTNGRGARTQWEYDARGWTTRKIFDDGSSYSFERDQGSRVISRTDAMARTIGYSYDHFDNVTAIDYPTDHDVAFVYDNLGRRISMTDSTGLSEWTYDAIGRVASSSQSGVGRRIDYTYHLNSQRATAVVSDSAGGGNARTITYQTDSIGRLSTIRDTTIVGGETPFHLNYDSDHSFINEITNPTGSKTERTFDSLGQMTQTETVDHAGSGISQFLYEFNLIGKRTREVASDFERSFTYDGKDQLIASTASNAPDLEFTYDDIGNRLSVNEDGNLTSYTPNNLNQYASVAGVDYQYDLNGNLLSDGRFTYEWDEQNRMVAVADSILKKGSRYRYDGIGRRIEKVDFELEPDVEVRSVRYLWPAELTSIRFTKLIS